MKLTNRHLAFIGVGVGAIGLALEWNKIFPGGKLSNPLVKRQIGTTPATGRPAVSATQSTAGRVTPQGTTSNGGLTLGSVLTPIAGLLGKLLGGSGSDRKPNPMSSAGSGGSGLPSSPGGSAGNVNAGRGAPFSADNNSGAVGTGPTGSSAYADLNGYVAYPAGDGTYTDEWGNQVYIKDDGTITYDATQDVGFVQGGEVFPDSYDPNDPSTFDFYPDGGPLADPGGGAGSDFFPDGGPLADPGISDWPAPGGDLYIADGGPVDPAMFSDDGWTDLGGDWGNGGGWGGSSEVTQSEDGF